MKKTEAFCEETVSLLLTAYLFIVFCMFPFYMRNGYVEIGKDKYNFYKAVAAGGFCLIVPFALLCLIFHLLRVWRAGKKDGIKGELWAAAGGMRQESLREIEGIEKGLPETAGGRERDAAGTAGGGEREAAGIAGGKRREVPEDAGGRERGAAGTAGGKRREVPEDADANRQEIPEEEAGEAWEPAAYWRGRLSGTDWAVLAYGISVILSYIGSDFRETAFLGEAGWYMGTVMQLGFVLSYFLVSRFWEYEGKMLFPFMAAAGVVFFIGLLNRFSIYPIAVEGANISFLSTMGNINWYCGYWSVLFPAGAVLYWKADRLWLRVLALLFTALGIAAGVSQGSSSAFIVFAGVYGLFFCLSFERAEAMKRFLKLAVLFCAVCQALRLWRLWRPTAYNYYGGTLSDWITLSRATLAGMLFLAVIYFFFWRAEKKKRLDMRKLKVLRQIAVLTAVTCMGVYILLLALNTGAEGGIRFMGNVSVLTFDELWGSARGATWSAAAQIYQEIPGLKRLIGVGPDCFASYLYTLPDLTKRVSEQFGGARLTNAHNEWLNMLVNVGIWGFLSYGGIFISAVSRFIYYGEKVFVGKGRYLCIFGFSAFAYTVHNMVSFQQILSTPFMFLMLGMGESLLRTEKRERNWELTNGFISPKI